MKPRIALIAHDKKKDDMVALAAEYARLPAQLHLSPPAPRAGA